MHKLVEKIKTLEDSLLLIGDDSKAAMAWMIKKEVEKLLRAMDLYKQASMQSHSGHFDMTMQHGAGCPECIRARELREQAEQLFYV